MPAKQRLSAEEVPLSEIAPGPVLRDRLTDEQSETARAIYSIVQPYFESFEAFELGFLRDQNPESELRIWTGIAMAYQRFNEMYTLANDQEREAAFTSCVLLRSGVETPPQQVPVLIWQQCTEITNQLRAPAM